MNGTAAGDILAMNLSRRRFLATGAGLAAAVAGGGLLRSNRLEAVRTNRPRRTSGSPPLRIALATDMHAPHDSFEADQLAGILADFDPDILLIAGDAINQRGDEHLVRAYEALPARFGKFAALGNWEYQGDCDMRRLRDEYERSGVRLLVNESAVVDSRGERIGIVGLDDLLRGRPRLDLLRRGAGPRADRSIVMAHCPALFDDVARASTEPRMVLSGHTHGGQVAPFGHVFMTPLGSGTYVKGWYEAPGTEHQLYVSRGLGNSRVPLRVGSRPEIALLTL